MWLSFNVYLGRLQLFSTSGIQIAAFSVLFGITGCFVICGSPFVFVCVLCHGSVAVTGIWSLFVCLLSCTWHVRSIALDA